MIFVQIFYTFFVIGIFTIGGGYAMLSLIQHQVVEVHGWLTAEAFSDIVAISQMTPGPIGINSATYVGYSVIEGLGYSKIVCILGSLSATMAVVLPSFIITLGVCKVYVKIKNSSMFIHVMSWFKPVVVGLMGAAAIMLITPATFIDYKSWILFVAAFLLMMSGKVGVIEVLLGGAVAGILLYAV